MLTKTTFGAFDSSTMMFAGGMKAQMEHGSQALGTSTRHGIEDLAPKYSAATK
jgi:hypothetical protein